jgi:prephenate dehydrogenase
MSKRIESKLEQIQIEKEVTNALETIKDNIDKKTPGYVASLFEMSREYRNSLESRHPEH